MWFRSIQKPNRLRYLLLDAGALVTGGLIFAPLYIFAVIRLLFPMSYQIAPGWLSALVLVDLAPNLLFSHLISYLLISGIGIALALAALLWRHPGRLMRILLILALVSIIAFPWFYRYYPAATAAPGYQMRVITQPGLLEGVVKKAQATAEIRPCAYTLLGWSVDGVLYYTEDCQGRLRTGAFDPAQGEHPRQVSQVPPNLIQETPVGWGLRGVRVPGVAPEEESQVRQVIVQEKGLASSDGRWVAVVARHLYGPEDVLVVESK